MEGNKAYYIELASKLLNGDLSPEDFTSAFINVFKRDECIYPESDFSLLDALFSSCDLYSDGEQSEWTVDLKTLRESAARVVQEISRV